MSERRQMNVLAAVVLGLATALVFSACDGDGGGHPPLPAPALSDYAGRYEGTFAGDDTGTFVVNISDSGVVAGTGNSAQDGAFNITGTVSSDGAFNATGSTTIGSTFTGQITAAGAISGTWVNSNASMSGTFSGNKT